MLIAKVIETYNAYLRKISPHQENCFPLCRCIGGTSQMKGRKDVKTVGWKHIQNETTKIS